MSTDHSTDQSQMRIAPGLPMAVGGVPVFQSGDRMNRIEFERRYNMLPHANYVELIEGAVHTPSPVSASNHGEPHFKLITWLGIYQINTPGICGGDNSSIRLDIDNMPQPDAYLRIEPEQGGKSIIVNGILEGPPELTVEISASSVSIDMHDKFQVYRRNEVDEYLVWRVQDSEIDWFQLIDGEYQKLQADEQSIIRSQVFPGLVERRRGAGKRFGGCVGNVAGGYSVVGTSEVCC